MLSCLMFMILLVLAEMALFDMDMGKAGIGGYSVLLLCCIAEYSLIVI